MIAMRIWGIAQLVNAAASLFVFGIEATCYISVFGFMGGLPAIPMFMGVLWLAAQATCKPRDLIALLLILMPLCTMVCAYFTLSGLGFREREIYPLLIMPALSTMAGVALQARMLGRYKQLQAR